MTIKFACMISGPRVANDFLLLSIKSFLVGYIFSVCMGWGVLLRRCHLLCSFIIIASPLDGWIPWRIHERLWLNQSALTSHIATDCITGATWVLFFTACPSLQLSVWFRVNTMYPVSI